MKALPLLLAASLVANATLVTLTLRHRSSAPDRDLASSSSSSRTASTDSAAAAKAALALPPEIVAAINTNNVETLRDFLRAAGFSEDIVRSIVQMRLWKNYEARFKALSPQPDPNRPWWKDDRNQRFGWNGGLTKAQREESRRLQREVRDETERLLGPDTNQNSGWQDPRLAFLSADKRKALQQVQQDYQDLIGEVQQDTQGFRLSSDTEKLRYLQEEQKRDIEALMTPEERQAYELRMSPSAQQLRWKMTQYDVSEQEYMSIFPLQKAFDEKYNKQANDPYGYGDNVERDQNYWRDRQKAEKDLQDQLKSIIGDQRYAEGLRRQDNDYQQLEAATRRLDLPADTPNRLFSLRDSAAASVQQVAANTSLSYDQKKAALASIAAQTRDQVSASLGSEGAEAYFKNNGMGWLKELERGNTISFRKDTTGWETTALPKDPKPAAAK